MTGRVPRRRCRDSQTVAGLSLGMMEPGETPLSSEPQCSTGDSMKRSNPPLSGEGYFSHFQPRLMVRSRFSDQIATVPGGVENRIDVDGS